MSDLDFDLLRSLKVKCKRPIRLSIYGFLLMFNANIGPNEAHLRDIRLGNLGDLEFDLSRSLKVRCEGAIGLPIYVFLLMFNRNIGPNQALLQHIRLQNLSDLDFEQVDLSRSLKVKCHDVIVLAIYVICFPIDG